MRHIFIINPEAGGVGEDGCRSLEADIRASAERLGVAYEIHRTECVGDAENISRRLCEKYVPESLRFYACGGDGTLGETANGVLGHENVEISVIPCGTGNDFVRNFAGRKAFSDIEAQIMGKAMAVDALICDGKAALNFVNMGFDCAVVEKVAELKKHPLITRSFAYIAGVVSKLVEMPCVGIKKLSVDGSEINAPKLLLLAAAGGGYYGGGFNSAPTARIDDGFIDLCLAYPMSRAAFVSMVGGYKNGSYIRSKRTLKHVSLHKCRRIDIFFDGEQSFCLDGEIRRGDELHIELSPRAISFSVPRGAEYLGASAESRRSPSGAEKDDERVKVISE